jgi:hypothetical protein
LCFISLILLVTWSFLLWIQIDNCTVNLFYINAVIPLFNRRLLIDFT